jgi:transcriptional regulator with XRE-family HTH domain
MSNLRIKFGRNLRRLRRQRDFTQEQLAEATEISVEFLSNIERGINAPSFETLEKLSKVLNVTFKELFDFDS